MNYLEKTKKQLIKSGMSKEKAEELIVKVLQEESYDFVGFMAERYTERAKQAKAIFEGKVLDLNDLNK